MHIHSSMIWGRPISSTGCKSTWRTEGAQSSKCSCDMDWSSLFWSPCCFYAILVVWGRAEWCGPHGTVWFYGWVRQSIEMGFDPSFTDWFFYPDGKEIFAHTGNNLVDAYGSVLFQWVLGEYFSGPFITSLVLINVIGLRWFYGISQLIVSALVDGVVVVVQSIHMVGNCYGTSNAGALISHLYGFGISVSNVL